MEDWRNPEHAHRGALAQVRSARGRRGTRSRRNAVLLALACLALLASPVQPMRAGEGTGRPGYRLGVFPYLPALAIDRVFGPVAASFAAGLGRPVHLKTRSSFESFAQQLDEEVYEIVFVHPFFYVQAAERADYRPLARLEGHLSAVALVRSERPWRTWSDLAGKTVGLPPALAAASELARMALVDAGLNPGVDATLLHYRTKAVRVQALSVGTADACVLPRFVLPQIKAIADGKLRIMAETPSIPHLVFATHPRVPDSDREKLRALILSWPETEQGRAILAAGPWPRFMAAHDRDYAQVRDYRTRLGALAER